MIREWPLEVNFCLGLNQLKKYRTDMLPHFVKVSFWCVEFWPKLYRVEPTCLFLFSKISQKEWSLIYCPYFRTIRTNVCGRTQTDDELYWVGPTVRHPAGRPHPGQRGRLCRPAGGRYSDGLGRGGQERDCWQGNHALHSFQAVHYQLFILLADFYF